MVTCALMSYIGPPVPAIYLKVKYSWIPLPNSDSVHPIIYHYAKMMAMPLDCDGSYFLFNLIFKLQLRRSISSRKSIHLFLGSSDWLLLQNVHQIGQLADNYVWDKVKLV